MKIIIEIIKNSLYNIGKTSIFKNFTTDFLLIIFWIYSWKTHNIQLIKIIIFLEFIRTFFLTNNIIY